MDQTSVVHKRILQILIRRIICIRVLILFLSWLVALLNEVNIFEFLWFHQLPYLLIAIHFWSLMVDEFYQTNLFWSTFSSNHYIILIFGVSMEDYVLLLGICFCLGIAIARKYFIEVFNMRVFLTAFHEISKLFIRGYWGFTRFQEKVHDIFF